MRIAYVCADPGVPVFGCKGCSVHVQEVIRALTRQGAQVDLMAAAVDGPPPPGLERVRVHRLPKPEGPLAAREQKALAANRDLYRALTLAAPVDLVYERYSLWSFAGMEYARATGVPAFLEVNAPLLEEQATYRSLVDRESADRVAARAFAAADVAVAVSTQVAAHIRRYRPDGPIAVLPNGVDPTRFPPGIAASLPGPAGSFTVGFVGSLKPWHGVSVLMEAFATLRQKDHRMRLVIVGDGPERRTLEADVAARDASGAVVFTGAVPPAAVPALLASMNVAVAPYLNLPAFYFSPLKVYEYMAAGLPVVASRIGQLATLIEHDVTGVLCAPGDPAALADALERLRVSPERRGRIGHAGREHVIRHHTWDRVAERIVQLADDVRRPRRPSCSHADSGWLSAGG